MTRLISLFFILLLCGAKMNYANAKIKITSLKENSHIFSQLEEYKIYTNECQHLLDRYSVIEEIEYYDMQNNLQKDGIIVVLDVLANSVVKIFDELKQMHFNINSIHPTKLYKKNFFGNIEMPDDFNGTESFVCRKVEHTDRLSLHSFGIALDINFLQNPCVFINEQTLEIQNVVPKHGTKYLNRNFNRKNKENQDIGKVNNEVISIFKKYGYDIWGGYWDFPIDYQHFQVSTRSFADLLLYANKDDSQKIFDIHTRCINKTSKSLIEIAKEKNVNLLELYQKDNSKMIKGIEKWCMNVI